MKTMRFLTVFVSFVVLVACGETPEPADLVITGGRIVTMDADRSEVEALAARGQQIVALGSVAEVAELIGASSGIGYMIINSQALLATGQIIFGIIVIGLIGLVSDAGFKALNRHLFPWRFP